MEVKDIAIREKEEFKQTEVGIIPADWNVKELGEIANIKRGKFTPRPRNDPRFYGGNIPFVQTGDVTNSNGRIANFSQTLNVDGLSVSVLFKKGTILMTIAANIGYTGILQVDMACPDSLVAIDGGRNNNNDFLNQYFIYKRQSLDKLSTSGAQKNLNIELLRPFQIPLPPTKAEQTAIATALSDTDALISRLETLIEKKRAIKQGAMQQLLKPKEGWVEKRLGDICFPSKNRIDPISSPNYRCIELEHLSQESGRLLGTVDSNTLKSQKSTFTNGDVLFGKLRPYLKKYLHAEFDGVCTTEIWVLKAFQEISSRWLFYLMQTDKVIEATNLSTGTKMPRAEWKTVSGTTVFIPSMKEQTRIAQILSDMDVELAGLEQKLAKYKLVKQGMMQELLTGKTRLV